MNEGWSSPLASRHSPFILECAGRALDLIQPQVMGILNVTPDSFSDGGLFFARTSALAQAKRMVAEGAAIIDVGGESTRPGARPIELEEELARVVPVIEAIARELPVVVSVDTSKPEVMRAAAAAGAGMINDVRALRHPGALEAAVETGLAVCLMHMQGEPGSMQQAPRYDDVVAEVCQFLEQRVATCIAAGIRHACLVVDPGFGFGKALAHNLTMLKHLEHFRSLGLPLLVGVSRKSMIGTVLNAPVGCRLYGSIALSALAVISGASIIRVHDVAATVEAVRMAVAVRDAQ